MKRFFTGLRDGFVKGLKFMSTVSSFATMGATATGQRRVAILFTATGYISDVTLLKMGEMSQRTFYTNLYLDATMDTLTSRYPVFGGTTNILTKTLVGD